MLIKGSECQGSENYIYVNNRCNKALDGVSFDVRGKTLYCWENCFWQTSQLPASLNYYLSYLGLNRGDRLSF